MKVGVGLVNKARLVQGWNILHRKDAVPVAEVWTDQLDRHGVSMKLYGRLLDMAVDHRVIEMSAGRREPSLSVELLISMFERYKAESYNELQSMKLTLSHVLDSVHQVETGRISIAEGVDKIGAVTGDFEGAGVCVDFRELAARVISRMQSKIEGFLRDRYLED